MTNESSFLGGLDILDGMPSRQSGAILFAIEGRTALLVSQSRQALASHLTEKTVAEKEQAFLSALAQGRDLPLQPVIQDIERFAPEWASLVPSDERQRATLANKLANKYRFRRQDIPAIRKALGLDNDGVKRAYQRLFQKPLDTIFVTSIPLSEKIRWLVSRLTDKLERLPPFWTAYSLTLTETVGGSVLALPIALAGIGPIPGVILLIILGLVNVLTVVGIVEAITRNGNMRYGTAYFGRLVGDFLGKPGSIILVPALLLLNITTLLAFYIGISVSLADITRISPLLWSALIFLLAVYYLRRESLNATVASALFIGIINILILICLSLLSFPHIQSANLEYVTSQIWDRQLFNPKILELIFGVVLFAYFGHTSAGNAAKVVLRRDPGGSSLIWGNMLALATAIALYSLWVIAVNGAIPAVALATETGTAISPLAMKIGGVVPILGIIYIILAMGMGTVHMSYGLYYQVREALPAHAKKTTQFLVSIAPIVLLFIIVQWILFTGRESFSWIFGILGVLLLPLLGGIFPMLMLAASRRKGDYIPQLSFRFLGNPVVLAIVYLIYLGSVFAYGFFIWDDPFQRFIAIVVGFIVLVVTVLVIRQGAFTSRVVIELRVEASDDGDHATLAIVDKGRPKAGAFRLVYSNAEESIKGTNVDIPSYKEVKNILIEFSSLSSKELKIWLHRVTQEGISEPVSAGLKIIKSNGEEVVLPGNHSQMIIPLDPQTIKLEISLNPGGKP